MPKFSFEESKHPRDKNGEFASKSGSASGGKKKRNRASKFYANKKKGVKITDPGGAREFVKRAAVLASLLVAWNHVDTKFRRNLRQGNIDRLKRIGFKDHHIAHAMKNFPEVKPSIFERGVSTSRKAANAIKTSNPFSEKSRSLKKILKGTGKVKYKFKKAAEDASRKYTIYDAGLNPRFD